MVVESYPVHASMVEEWNHSIEPGATYMHDPMHFPHPMTPLSASTMGPAFAIGASAGFRALTLPMESITVIHRNHYRFERWGMVEPASPDHAAAIGQAAEASMQREIGRMMERWQGEHLPSILAHHRQLRAFDVATASPSGLSRILSDAQAIHEDLWRIHFEVVAPMMLSMQLFDELYADLLGGSEAEGHALLVGGLSESVKAGIGLSDLAGAARQLGVDDLIVETAPGNVVAALSVSQAGQVFLIRLREYLREYGLRQDLFEYATPTWQEDPTIALANIRNYLVTGHDARAEQAAISRAAAEALESARQRLGAYPEPVRGQFEAMVQFGRQGAFLQEEHNFYIDQQATALLRLLYLRFGQRFVDAGLLDRADDVFLLYIHELDECLIDLQGGGSPFRLRNIVAERCEELAAAASLAPPPFIGEPPSGPPSMDNPMERAMVRFFGGPPQEAGAASQLQGNPGSRGTASGVARVARTLEDAQALEPGEILVAITTMPAWTPLFGVAAAVVTETGGALSHCAIVAREYGIPAVVGAHGATSRIETGQRVSVDGATGVVTIDD